MKKNVFLYISLSFISILIISSCMGEEGRIVAVANQPGVIIKDGTETTVQLRDIQIYADNFGSSVDGDDCLIFQYKIDFDLLANGDSARGVQKYKAEILRTDTVHQENLSVESVVDTTLIRPKELTVSSIQQRYAVILDQFFLYTSHQKDTLHKKFDLIYFSELEPVSEDGKKIYNLYLRVEEDTIMGKLTDPDKTIFINAFNIHDVLAMENEKDTVYFKVKYPTTFNKDTTEITNWSSSPLFNFPADILTDY